MRHIVLLGCALHLVACSSDPSNPGSASAAGTANATAGSGNGTAGDTSGTAGGSAGGAAGSGASGGTAGNGTAGNGTAGNGAVSGGGSQSNPLSQTIIDEFVAAHNSARSGPLNPAPSPALAPVSWDPILADSAYNYLVKCVPNGSLVAHNANRSTDYQALGGTGYVGENIYASTAKTVTAAQAVDSWMSEASMYDYNANNITDAGHYTQVVWRSSVRIGCAIVNCPGIMYPNTILCDYAPGGNNTQQKPY